MIVEKIKRALKEALASKGEPDPLPGMVVEPPREKGYGDFYTNAGFLLGKKKGLAPLRAAEELASQLSHYKEIFRKVEVKGPGFLNFEISPKLFVEAFMRLVNEGAGFLYPQLSQGEPVLVEFVSANPTGPLHVGNGRGGVIGDVTGNLLNRCGYKAEKEYYVNDGREGTQMEKLGISFQVRIQQTLGQKLDLPEDAYPGEYLLEMAQDLSFVERKQLVEADLVALQKKASSMILENQKSVLSSFGLSFNRFVHEDDLLTKSYTSKVMERFNKIGLTKEEEGAWWFKATAMGEKKDEVLVRSNKKPTYFLTDIAYHLHKLERGYKKLINVWGSDHHGHIHRLKAALKALGFDPCCLTVILYQLVRLVENGEPMKMSKRAGEYMTLEELIDEVGKDAARIFFLSTHSSSPLDFDIQLAKKQSMENPAFYIHYAQCRIRSLYRKKEEMGLRFEEKPIEWEALNAEEKNLIKHCLLLESESFQATRNLEPHRLYFYLSQLASLFHSYYQKHPILTSPSPLREMRWTVVRGVEKVLLDLFDLIGITPLERM